jgi:putative ABC transport system permease protein
VAGGYWFGYKVTQLYAQFFRFPDFEYRMLVWVPLSAVVIAMAAASLGALNALRRVVHLPPAEAMRPATPPVFRATLGERLGFGHLYSPAVRMIVRDIERRPLRAAILIAGIWWRDAIDYLLDVEMRMRDRQEVSLALVEPVSVTTLNDFARLPGVLRAEPDRDVVVRLSNGPRTYRTSLSGLKPDLQMRPLLDENLQARPMPGEGIVLNQRLADRLKLALGDPVRVQVLQGNRAEAVVTVVGLSHEMMQMPATMDRDALNRLLGEGDAISGARLIIDQHERAALFHAIRETPRIAVAVEIGPIVRSVRENSARNILFFTTVMAVLAAAIALGVVYNNARIALAERAWDLASLRVLGFTRGEVSGLLLGELAAELLLALPLGCVIGNWLAWSMLQQMQMETMQLPFVIAPRTYALSCLIVLAAGVASALIVRRRIDQLDLVAVLKTRE